MVRGCLIIIAIYILSSLQCYAARKTMGEKAIERLLNDIISKIDLTDEFSAKYAVCIYFEEKIFFAGGAGNCMDLDNNRQKVVDKIINKATSWEIATNIKIVNAYDLGAVSNEIFGMDINELQTCLLAEKLGRRPIQTEICYRKFERSLGLDLDHFAHFNLKIEDFLGSAF